LTANWLRAARDPRPQTLVRTGSDRCKQVNGALGHAAGNFVLQAVTAILRDETRPGRGR
jgi:GGDEF domain-containing protein